MERSFRAYFAGAIMKSRMIFRPGRHGAISAAETIRLVQVRADWGSLRVDSRPCCTAFCSAVVACLL